MGVPWTAAPLGAAVSRCWSLWGAPRLSHRVGSNRRSDRCPFFVNGLEETYEEVGAKRVAINGNGPDLAKRMATGQGVSTLLHIHLHLESKRTEGVAPFLILLLDAHGRGFLT